MRMRAYAAGLLAALLMSIGMAAAAQEATQGAPDARRIAAEVQRLGLLEDLGQREVNRIIRGYEIAPVPLNLRGKDLLLVGLGSYLVNAGGGCNDCHTAPPYAPGGDPFLGQPKQVNADRYLAGGVPFGPPGDPNTPVSRNLTPRSNGRPANLTLTQFIRTLRTGEDLKNRLPHVPSEANDLLQVMPWPVYGDLRERDLRAMYEYLKAIPSLPSAP